MIDFEAVELVGADSEHILLLELDQRGLEGSPDDDLHVGVVSVLTPAPAAVGCREIDGSYRADRTSIEPVPQVVEVREASRRHSARLGPERLSRSARAICIPEAGGLRDVGGDHFRTSHPASGATSDPTR